MRVTTPIILAGLLLATAAAQAASILDQARDAMSGSMAGMLESQLGVTEEQAEGGLGSILTLAEDRLAAGDFDRLLEAIPGADGYLDKARELGITSLSDVEGLNDALNGLGIDQQTVARFVPMVQDLVTQLGGEDVGRLLASALGG